MRARRPDGPTIVGIILVLLGLAWLLGRVANVDMTQVPWPLYIIVPGVVVFLLSVLGGRRGLIDAGARAALAGLAIFLVGAVFFELILNIGGDHFGQPGRVALSIVLVVFGLLWLALNLRPF